MICCALEHQAMVAEIFDKNQSHTEQSTSVWMFIECVSISTFGLTL